jgi:acetyl-CoA C-acetyltransferase
VLTVAFEKQSESDAMWALSPRIPFQPTLVAGAGGYFAPLVRSYIQRSGAPAHIGVQVAVKDRLHALKNPYAHLQIEDIDRAMVEASPMLWDPIRYLETCPSSDGACAMVLASDKAAAGCKRPAWVRGTAVRSEPTMFAGRDAVNPQAGQECAKAVYREAGISDPRKELDTAEIYVPFSWFEPMWLENLGLADVGEGWRMTDRGRDRAGRATCRSTRRAGCSRPTPSARRGCCASPRPPCRCAGMAGEHQVDGARSALGHAYGGGSQFFAMWVVSQERP